MKTVTQHIRDRLENQIRPPVVPKPGYEELVVSEWDHKFEQYMRNRLIFGAIRYQTFADKKRGHKFNLIDSIRRRILAYEVTGNQEHLVDSANLLMIEFSCPTYPNAHFSPIDDGEHVQEKA